MNRSRNHSLRHTAAALLLVGALFASCSQDDLATGQGEPLTPGMYPLEITVGGLQAVAMPGKASAPGTRSTVDNDWNGVTKVAVQVGSEVKEYDVKSTDGGKTATLTSTSPFYWQATDEKKTVTAWHPCSTTYPTDWKVKADQCTADGYEASDLIRGVEEMKFADKIHTITFSHQTAKVTVNLTAGDGVALDENASVQLLNVSGVEGGTNTITPYRHDTDNTKRTYLALLSRQTIGTDKDFIKITTNGLTYSYKPDEPKELVAGTAYTFNITVKATGLEVTVNESIGWDTGNSGEGSVTLPYDISLSGNPQTIDLEDGDVVNITGDATTAITTGSYITFNISEGHTATVNLNNVTLKYNGDHGIRAFFINGGGTIIFKLNGTENTIDGFYNAIRGDWDGTAAHIHVIGPGTLNVTGNNVCGGIVTDKQKDIRIENATLNFNYKYSSGSYPEVAIGSGSGEECGNITIINSDISIRAELNWNLEPWYGAAIGAGTWGNCGGINITLQKGQKKADFLGKIDVTNQYNNDKLSDDEKIGKGRDGSSCGTTTWLNSDGTPTE